MRPNYEQIKLAFEEEKRQAAPVRSAEEIPFRYDLITEDWLSDVLCRKVPSARVLGFRLGDVDEGTSSRRRIYLEYNDAGQAGGLPESVFCKATQSLACRCLLGPNGAIESEVTFHARVRPTLDIEAPRAIFARFDPRTLNSIIVMHDLRGTVDFCSHATPMTRERVHNQLDLLARLHAAYYEKPSIESELHHLNTWPEFFRATAVEANFGPYADIGFKAAEAVIPPRLFKRATEVWPATLKTVAYHNDLPRTYVHSDVHLKNWYITRDGGRMGVGDWQCGCLGHVSRDLSYAIATAVTIEQRRLWEEDLLKYYLDRLQAEGGPRIRFDAAWLNYRQQMFSALAWWTPVLTPNDDVPDMQPRDTSLEFIKRITHAMDDLDSLGAAEKTPEAGT